VTGYNLKNT